MGSDITRRTILMNTAAVGVGTAVAAAVPTGVATAAPSAGRPEKQPEKRPVSANGWEIEDRADHISTVWTRPVSGTGLETALRIGDVEAVLVHVIRRFHYEVERINTIDLAGWRKLGGTSRKRPESNLSSGTAVRIRPGAGAEDSYFPQQVLTIRDILADCEGTVRWGGDDEDVDESLYYVAVGPDSEALPRVAWKIREWNATPGAGAGVIVDPSLPARRKRVQRYR
ncbi:hypothetical protein V1L54_09350 [Streptomyces sp. TRM 70361]|uniref:hypothetical protein n=1 Tax=Streptomyces sp. TRM 70361 TaxID=3116553 RepID=UPI002E7B279D|nr:hypothetical protein [Streptomyces sp. TRM 70361]MEE1939620.1 hypothetical protein [Streptomyces sp. TRM 70361]